MKVTVAGYNCSVTTDDYNLPEPDEVQVFEGDEIAVEAQLTAFAVRFTWIQVNIDERD